MTTERETERLLREQNELLRAQLEQQAEKLERIAQATERGAKAQAEFLNRQISEYSSFAKVEFSQIAYTQNVDADSPDWYSSFNLSERSMVRERIGWLNAANIKLAKGGFDEEAVVKPEGLQITKKNLDLMWREMPGFDMALTSIFRNIFENGNNNLVISEEGKSLLSNVDEFKRGLADDLSLFFEAKPDLLRPNNRWPQVDPEAAALAAVGAAWNLVYLSGAIESADLFREARGGVAETLRALLHPWAKGKSKWCKPIESRSKTVRADEESFGGMLGRWYVERLSNFGNNGRPHDEQLRKRFEAGDSMIPQTMLFSMFEHTRFSGGDLQNQTVACVLMNQQVGYYSRLGNGLLYEYQGRAIDFKKLDADDLWANWSGLLDKVVKIKKRLFAEASGDKDATLLTGVIDSLNKLRGIDELMSIYTDEDFVTLLILSYLGGPKLGTSKLIPGGVKNDASYDLRIENVINNMGLFHGMDKNARTRIKNKLCSVGTNVIFNPGIVRRLRRYLAYAESNRNQFRYRKK